MRNFAVLHIVAEESRIFKTKERCPLLLCFEVYRPTEISLESVPDALTMQRMIAESTNSNKNTAAVRFEAVDMKEINSGFEPLRRPSGGKKGYRAQTLTQSHTATSFPFANEDDAVSANPATKNPNLRNSVAGSIRSHETDTDSFVSAVESPSQVAIQKAEEKLRLKKQKQA